MMVLTSVYRMKKYLLPPAISLALIFVITHDDFASSLINFFIAGVIPGTVISLPFWAMIAMYCLTITAIVTIYLETTLITRRTTKTALAHKQQLPRRRYSNI